MPFHIGPEKFCDYNRKKSLFYDEMKASGNLPAKNVCPWPPGIYELRGVKAPVKKVPWFLEGDHIVELRLTKNSTLMNGFQVFFTVFNV
jgi:Protein of unknown function (DUF1091)